MLGLSGQLYLYPFTLRQKMQAQIKTNQFTFEH